MNRVTFKEIKSWIKSLEENRYKKIYNSDARRVAWFVNNDLSEDYESMPTSYQKKLEISRQWKKLYPEKY